VSVVSDETIETTDGQVEQPGDPQRPARRPPSRAARQRAGRRPTIKDLAALAGVSRGTVSRALRGGHYVSPGAQAAVNRAVLETGYVVNRNARSLVTQRADSVAFVLSEPQEKLFSDPNFNVLLRSATQALAAHDLQLVLTFAGTAAERERLLNYLRTGHVDGVLLVSAHGGDPLMDELERGGLPVVACGKPLGHETTIPYVAADERAGARQIVEHLRDGGRKRIATITGPLDTPGGLGRLEGYCDVVGRRPSKRRIAHGDYSYEGGEAAMRDLLERGPDLDAVFAASDMMAAGALSALHAAGLRVPTDVAVGGFDDSRVATSTSPPLTTVHQPLDRVAFEMVRLLVDLLDGKEVDSLVLPTELVVRATT
jgi:DNA-binding LacI/PurR family transcriptional regulator